MPDTRTDFDAKAAHTAVLGLLATEPGADFHTTLGRKRASGPSSVQADSVRPSIRPGRASDVLEAGAQIGEGGMGIIRTARQKSVGRDVAVKSLRMEYRFEEAEVWLLKEAWLTASLEHPNVVPVHDVLFDQEEGPLIVLKQVKGITWDVVMGDEAAVRERFNATDLLEFNLDVLMQLCRALHFAHVNDIVHRDIKPANVMVGSFGEVYLLDWGIAVTLVPDPSDRLPVADASIPAGTLAYMAPEMLDTKGEISARTDVYLLGAVLYEVVVGRAPHNRANNRATAMSILESRPEFPDHVPEEMQRIVARAMSRDPLDRYESADAFRLAIQRYLKSRYSMNLVDEAMSRYGDLTWMLETHDPERVDKVRLFELFGECRFGLMQAIVSSEDNLRAKGALAKLLDRIIGYLVETGDPGAAAALFADHPAPDPALRERVDVAVEAQKREHAELERLQRDLDPTVGAGTRRSVMAAMGLTWTAAPLLANVVDPETTPAVVNFASPAGLLMLALVVWYFARDKLSKTAINRRFLVAMLVGFCAHMVHLLVVATAGLDPKTELPMGMVSFGAIAAVLAHTAEKRFWPVMPVYWVGAILGAMSVPHAAYVLSGCNLVLTIYMFAIWSPRSSGGQVAS